MYNLNAIFKDTIFGDWLMREIEFVTETEGIRQDSPMNLTLTAYKGLLMAPLMSMTAGAAALELSVRKAADLAQVVLGPEPDPNTNAQVVPEEGDSQ